MSDKISVRIITTQKGYARIMGLLEYWGAKELIETTAFANVNKQYGNIVYLGWDRIGNNRKKMVKSIMAVLMDSFKISYRTAIISKNAEDVYINSQICRKDGDLPNIFLNCRFDNKKIESELEQYTKEMEGK